MKFKYVLLGICFSFAPISVLKAQESETIIVPSAQEWELSPDIIALIDTLKAKDYRSRSSVEQDLWRTYGLYLAADQHEYFGKIKDKIEYARLIRQKFFEYEFAYADCDLAQRKEYMKHLFHHAKIRNVNPTDEILRRILYFKLSGEENGELTKRVIELNRDMPEEIRFDFNKKELFFIDHAIVENKMHIVKAFCENTNHPITEKTVLLAIESSPESFKYFLDKKAVPSKKDIIERMNKLMHHIAGVTREERTAEANNLERLYIELSKKGMFVEENGETE